MAALRTAVIMAGSLSAPVAMVSVVPMMMEQPLATAGPDEEVTQRHSTLRFSQIAISGQHLFRANCSDCHGEDASGTDRGPDLRPAVKNGDRGNRKQMFHSAISNGVSQQNWAMGDMPAFPRLSFNQIEQIERYVRELKFPISLGRG